MSFFISGTARRTAPVPSFSYFRSLRNTPATGWSHTCLLYTSRNALLARCVGAETFFEIIVMRAGREQDNSECRNESAEQQRKCFHGYLSTFVVFGKTNIHREIFFSTLNPNSLRENKKMCAAAPPPENFFQNILFFPIDNFHFLLII